MFLPIHSETGTVITHQHSIVTSLTTVPVILKKRESHTGNYETFDSKRTVSNIRVYLNFVDYFKHRDPYCRSN